jgi:hypothetical protein
VLTYGCLQPIREVQGVSNALDHDEDVMWSGINTNRLGLCYVFVCKWLLALYNVYTDFYKTLLSLSSWFAFSFTRWCPTPIGQKLAESALVPRHFNPWKIYVMSVDWICKKSLTYGRALCLFLNLNPMIWWYFLLNCAIQN